MGGKYNQFLSDYSMLVRNRFKSQLQWKEALETAKLFGKLLDIVMQNNYRIKLFKI